MKLSNKLLLGLLIFILASVTILLGTAKYYSKEYLEEGQAKEQEMITPPAPPEAPAVPGK